LSFGDSDLRKIKKLGEGTFGEAFKGDGNVFKIVPMDGRFQVNGETQKV
jgi:serine/threonine-protein kinase haspin